MPQLIMLTCYYLAGVIFIKFTVLVLHFGRKKKKFKPVSMLTFAWYPHKKKCTRSSWKLLQAFYL